MTSKVCANTRKKKTSSSKTYRFEKKVYSILDIFLTKKEINKNVRFLRLNKHRNDTYHLLHIKTPLRAETRVVKLVLICMAFVDWSKVLQSSLVALNMLLKSEPCNIPFDLIQWFQLVKWKKLKLYFGK